LNAQIVFAEKDYIKTIYNVFRKADVDIDGIIPVTLAEKNLILDEADQKDSVMLVDIGAQNTDVGVFEGSKYLYTTGIPVGGQNITNDLSICLNVTKDEAEKLKRQYGLALKSYIENDQEVVLNTAKDGNTIVKSSNIVEIIEARVEQIFDLINKEIIAQGLKQRINTVVLTGEGITNISKSDIVAKITLNIPVKMASNKIANLIKPSYATAYGLVRYIAARPFAKTVSSSIDTDSKEGTFKKIFERIKEFFYS
jgi:cell division protein FtsA